jgi:uncharacterized protein
VNNAGAEFPNREEELARLTSRSGGRRGGLVVLFGRRRIGKTRPLAEWTHREGGINYVADESSAEVQRAYFAQAITEKIPGFADVSYGGWKALFGRLVQDVERAQFRAPIVIDELPYLVGSSPELPSVLQNWLDGPAKRASLLLALAGSNQRMMEGPHRLPICNVCSLFQTLSQEPSRRMGCSMASRSFA